MMENLNQFGIEENEKVWLRESWYILLVCILKEINYVVFIKKGNGPLFITMTSCNQTQKKNDNNTSINTIDILTKTKITVN